MGKKGPFSVPQGTRLGRVEEGMGPRQSQCSASGILTCGPSVLENSGFAINLYIRVKVRIIFQCSEEREGKRKGTGVLTHWPEHRDPTPAKPSGDPHPLADDLKLTTQTASFHTLQASTRHTSSPRASAPERPRPGRGRHLASLRPYVPLLGAGPASRRAAGSPQVDTWFRVERCQLSFATSSQPLSLIASSLQTASTE
uniref:Uncharacterized protein n=1 Tax=Rangifer tarandus platyrhynchus TaxID=3082113 RepID=A0ACB0EG67_RANTA|nr:unnamed protein product [Rangifer tarandus platyrhynchus]